MRPYERNPPDLGALLREVATFQPEGCGSPETGKCSLAGRCGCEVTPPSSPPSFERQAPARTRQDALRDALLRTLSLGEYGEPRPHGFTTQELVALRALPPELAIAALQGVVASYHAPPAPPTTLAPEKRMPSPGAITLADPRAPRNKFAPKPERER